MNGERKSTEAEDAFVGPHRWQIVVALVAIVVIVAAVVVITKTTPQPAEAGTAPGVTQPGINKTMATLLQLDNIRSVHETEPSFHLTDQKGRPMSADEFRGRAVVFTLNDNHCTDLCTLLAQDIVAADRDLGAEAKRVAFVSINANPFYPSVAADAAWSTSHHLDALPNWYYGTGSPATLKKDWRKFGLTVELDRKNRTVVHSTDMFFINPQGQEVEMAQFGTESADTAPYAHAMAQAAVDLLPASQRTPVKGPSLVRSTSGAALNSIAPVAALPSLKAPSTTYSTAEDRGKYTVVNFWSSTCTACQHEMPGLEATYKQFDGKIDFLGDDVSDIAKDGLQFADRYGVTYPLVDDESGTLSGDYRIAGLPETVILGPSGRVLIRHSGVITEAELVYILHNMRDNGPDQSGIASDNG